MVEDGAPPIEGKLKLPIFVFLKDTRLVFKMDSLGKEILLIALPAALALAADPIASLIDTAFIGHIGPVEIAAVGISIAIFNQVSKVAIFTTSFVAEEETIRLNNEEIKPNNKGKGSTTEEIEQLMLDGVKLENVKDVSVEKDEEKGLKPY